MDLKIIIITFNFIISIITLSFIKSNPKYYYLAINLLIFTFLIITLFTIYLKYRFKDQNLIGIELRIQPREPFLAILEYYNDRNKVIILI
jgi:hypothetical protein